MFSSANIPSVVVEAMHIDRGGAATSGSPKKLFDGVRFVLFGFDSVSESQYRSELMNGGGIDVGRYDSSCTHVIVSGRVYDDPVCVLASNDGKILVTELWIDDSLNFGMLADSTKVLYRPVRDLNGIPGSELIHICLTGYQRQERDDIMKMVSLMGARFSKPLIANQVTHLICYKFEGEKYELAKRVNIKLVNHHWLEDCLTTWEILPIDKYTKSAWELEVLEAQAMDSEEENDGGGRKFAEEGSIAQPSNSRGAVPVKVAPGVLMHDNRDMGLLNSTVPIKPPNLSTNNKLFSLPCGDGSSQKANDFCNSNSNLQGRTENVRDDHGIVGDIVSKQSSTSDYVNVSRKCIGLPSDVSITLISTSSLEEDKKLSLSCYSSKVPERVVSPEEKMEETKANINSDISSTKSNASAKLCMSDDLCTPLSGTNTSNVEGRTCSLPQKRKLSVLRLKQDQISRTPSLMDTPNIFSAKPNNMKPRGFTADNMPFHNDASGSVCSVIEQSDAFPQKQKQCISSNIKESAELALQTSSTCTKQNPSTNIAVPYKETDAGFTRNGNFEATTPGNPGVNQQDAVSKRRSSIYKRKSIKDYSYSSLVKFSGEFTPASDHNDESFSNGFPPKPVLDMKTSETSGEMAGVSNMYSMSSRDGKLVSDCPVINESGQIMNTSAGRHANFLRSWPASEVADGNEASNSMNFLQQENLRETEAAVKFESHNVVALRCKLDLHSETTSHRDRAHEHPEVLPSDLSEKKVETCAEIPGECKQQKIK
ncbi:hypothetical protein HPP92_002051 [Vanilla planifolia]|uniref:BRCT domain-containing protein n=1 Tax=Vanilla planifolia TaxID=51239 RepID=A0A835RRT8_VANPL|nr:hypothetical protein HPP92_002051 [Vanilla planifolia]